MFKFECASSGWAQLGSFLQKPLLTLVAIVSVTCKPQGKKHNKQRARSTPCIISTADFNFNKLNVELTNTISVEAIRLFSSLFAMWPGTTGGFPRALVEMFQAFLLSTCLFSLHRRCSEACVKGGVHPEIAGTS